MLAYFMHQRFYALFVDEKNATDFSVVKKQDRDGGRSENFWGRVVIWWG